MKNIKIALVDNDYVVLTKTDLDEEVKDDRLGQFFQEIEEELATGKTAYLEIEGLKRGPITFEISRFE